MSEAMSETTTGNPNYLTIAEVASELCCKPRNIYKLIKAKKLGALKISERQTLVTRWALDAYKRRINGEPSLVVELPAEDTTTLLARFSQQSGGLSPAQVVERFKAGEFEDSSENMTLLIRAMALGGASGQSTAPLEKEEAWAIAALSSTPKR